jgi:P4 family phage/plasmid primase-like protien
VLSGKTGQEKFHIWTGCHAKGTPILMHSGKQVKVEKLKVGDTLMGPDSEPRVIQKLVTGQSKMYSIISRFHNRFTVNELHMLSLKAVNTCQICHIQGSLRYRVIWHEKDLYNLPVHMHKTFSYQERDKTEAEALESAQNFLDEILNNPNENMIKNGDIVDIPVLEYMNRYKIMGNGNYQLYSKAIDFPEQDLDIEPYLVGYILASKQNNMLISKHNPVTEKLDQLARKYNMERKHNNNKVTYHILEDMNEDSLFRKMEKLDIYNNKHIPVSYLVNSIQNRMELLAGMIDAKGTFDSVENTYKLVSKESTSKNKIFVKNIEYLTRSLGYKTKIQVVHYNEIDINLTPTTKNMLPVKNRELYNDNLELLDNTYTFEVQPVSEDNYYGFTVDKDHLYVTGDFLVHHNCGGNGKSKIIELFELAFGDYCGKLSVTNVTQKRPASNACTPELLKNKGKRFVTLQEPDDDEQIHVGAMKELTGGDKIQARGLHKDPIEFKPQWKIVMTSNVLPQVSANDNGTWRRIRVTEFISRFMEPKDMKPGKKYQFPIDYDLSTKLQMWPEAFMYILIQNYHNFVKNGLKEPHEVMKNTEAYKEESDCMLQFVNECLVEKAEEKLKVCEVYNHFKDWYKNSGNSNKIPNKKDFKGNLSKEFGDPDKKGYWRGITFLNMHDDDDDDEDEDD